MSLIKKELDNGIKYWRTTNWPKDFHCSFYKDIRKINSKGLFNKEWWDAYLPILAQWRATRPKSNLFLTNRAIKRFQILDKIWNKDISPFLDGDIEKINWDTLNKFVQNISEIKNVKSPVFQSKLCHFLAPKIFPVIDNKAMGKPFKNYKDYYLTAQNEWISTDKKVKNELISFFKEKSKIGDIKKYPFKCKIIELCFIGRKYKNG